MMIALGVFAFLALWLWAWGAWQQARRVRDVFESVGAWNRARGM